MPKVMTIGSLKIKDTLPAGSFEPPLGRLAGVKGMRKKTKSECCLVSKKTGRAVKCGSRGAMKYLLSRGGSKKFPASRYTLTCRSSGIGNLITIEGKPRKK